MGIGAMHDAGFAHCDIKPANVLLDINEWGQLVPIITDFGITRVITSQALKVGAFKVSELNGASLRYAAPEAIQRFRTGYSTDHSEVWKMGDVYSLSMTLVHLILRKGPWYKTLGKLLGTEPNSNVS